jgi:hypothetical protein
VEKGTIVDITFRFTDYLDWWRTYAFREFACKDWV